MKTSPDHVPSIVLEGGKILDGWNRARAHEINGTKPVFIEFIGTDTWAFVWATNDNRRHMTVADRASVYLMFKKEAEKRGMFTREQVREVAKTAQVSLGTAQKINAVAESTSAALKDAVIDQKISLKRGAELAKLPPSKAERALESKPQKHPAISVSDRVLDKMGYPVPAKIVPLWNRGPEVVELLGIISKARIIMRKAMESEDLFFSGVSVNSICSRLDLAYSELEPATPAVVCTTCQGVTPKTCTFCRGRGYISKFAWKTQVPEEIKVMRKVRIKELQEGGK